MKKLILTALLIFFLSPAVYAASSDTVSGDEPIKTSDSSLRTSGGNEVKTPESVIGGLVDELPEDALDLLPDGAAEDIVSGGNASDKLNAGFFLSLIGKGLRSALKDTLAAFCSVTAMIILSSLLLSVGSSASQGLEKICRFVGGGCVVTTVLTSLIPVKKLVSDTLFGVGLIVKSSLPALTFLCASSGGVSQATLGSVWLSAFMTVIEEVAETVLSPLVSILLGFAAVSAFSSFSGSPDLSRVSSGLKKTFVTLISLSSAILTAVMAYQNAVSKSADSLLLRSIKFASGNLIPVIGGALGEAAGNYLAGISLIKSSAGTLVTVCLIVYLVPVLTKLLILRFVLSLEAAVAGIFGCVSESSFLRECGDTLGLFLAVVALAGLVFVISIAIII